MFVTQNNRFAKNLPNDLNTNLDKPTIKQLQTSITTFDEQVSKIIQDFKLKVKEAENFEKCIKRLLTNKKLKLNVNFKDDSGSTALDMAVANMQEESVEILFKFGADATSQNNEGKTPLNLINDLIEKNHYSVHRSKLEQTKELFKLKRIKKCIERYSPGTSTGLPILLDNKIKEALSLKLCKI